MGCLKNRCCIYTRTRATVCCTLRILSGSMARAGHPNRVHRHRRRTGALYNAVDAPGRVWPPLWGLRLSRAAKLQRQSRGCTVRPTHELLAFWPPASASAAVTAAISHNHLAYPI